MSWSDSNLCIFIIDTFFSKFTPGKKEFGCANRAEDFSAEATKLLLKNRRLCPKSRIADFFNIYFLQYLLRTQRMRLPHPFQNFFSQDVVFFNLKFKIEKHKEFFSKKNFTSKHSSGLVDWCFRNALQKFHKQWKKFRSQSEKKTIQLFVKKTKENLWNYSFGHVKFRFRFQQPCRN